jgi:membrane protein implicated in regulation of membrane protease activity
MVVEGRRRIVCMNNSIVMVLSFAVAVIASLAFAYTIGWWLVWLLLFLWSALFTYSAREVLRDEETKKWKASHPPSQDDKAR